MTEIRNFENGTASATGRLVSGYAVRFDEVSVPIGGKFREVIAKNAFDQELVNNCKIEARLNHDPKKVLASNFEGTLELEVRNDGLFYAFEAPENEIGDELVDAIRDGKINASSFGFIIEQEDVKDYSSAGENFRTIIKIKELFDVSPVYNPAYTTTSCNVRSEEAEEKTEETPIVEEVKTEEVKEETTEKVEENKEKIRNLNCNKNMEKEKKFSLLKAIRANFNGKNFDESDQKYFDEGREKFRAAGLNPEGQIQIPFDGNFRSVTVTAEGEDVVETELMDILKPLYAKNVLIQAGAKFYDGLVGNVQIPIMSQTNVTWEDEVSPATSGDPTFSHVTLTPHRLTTYVDISKQLLAQDSVGVENNIREAIVASINSKLEDTILGTEAGTTSKPSGMFYGATVVSGCSGMTDFANIEEAVESANVYEAKKYVMNPKVKATLRTLAKGANISQSLYENGELDGTPCLVTSHVPSKKFIYGDWSQLAIGQWGGLDLVIDNVTQATKGCIRLVINAYFDAKVLRSEAFKFGSVN